MNHPLILHSKKWDAIDAILHTNILLMWNALIIQTRRSTPKPLYLQQQQQQQQRQTKREVRSTPSEAFHHPVISESGTETMIVVAQGQVVHEVWNMTTQRMHKVVDIAAEVNESVTPDE